MTPLADQQLTKVEPMTSGARRLAGKNDVNDESDVNDGLSNLARVGSLYR